MCILYIYTYTPYVCNPIPAWMTISHLPSAIQPHIMKKPGKCAVISQPAMMIPSHHSGFPFDLAKTMEDSRSPVVAKAFSEVS